MDDQLLLEPHRRRRRLEYRTDQLEGRRFESVRRRHAIDQAPFERLRGGDTLARQEQLSRAAGADQGRQQRRLDHRWDAHPDLRQAHARLARGRAQVAGHRQLEARPQAVTIHHAEGREGRLVHRPNGLVEPSAANAAPGTRYQFERLGYFCVDTDSAPEKLVFNRTVTLRDTWAKIEKAQKT